MLSIDTNILLYAQNQDCAEHARAKAFIEASCARDDVAVCELVLVELYQLLRNPAVLAKPLSAPEAAAVCMRWRSNPRWALIENAPIMDKLWQLAQQADLPRRAVFDARIALTVRHHGVTEWATRNTSDFEAFGFARLINPID
ncbi:MAG: TA system VapC family ribonuclease toxin [Lamprobacter sp.]|uniref:TA system VapC family ribonuclease toxin n=1 Tax=Lamprobacter sp. TaxID=3100796 RepID=UPI002B25EDD0|nr:TA system VapC family ribonuclease toxin [Lamprobacter sp.]MEA3643324.1 TA system VapC family ribonuclease toxin [Lamprobacter sp.]